MGSAITIYAGNKALSIIREQGLRLEDISIIAGAAGGPKWLILSQLDRFLFGDWLNAKTEPLHFIGASIGAWRFAAAAAPNPLKALEVFEYAYLRQSYSDKPSPAEVSDQSRKIMEAYLSENDIRHILSQHIRRLNVLSVRCRGWLAEHRKLPLTIAFAAAAGLNAFSRSLLNLAFTRTVFVHPQTDPSFLIGDDFHHLRVVLNEQNFRKALLASGSIPLVMEGVSDIPGAPLGTYRDGGITDYHLDVPFVKPEAQDRKLVLFPHYTDRIIPGWFDKPYTWRKPRTQNMDRVVLAAPSTDCVSRLPYHKIPDRKDFWRFKGDDKSRIAYWTKVVAESARFRDAFVDAISGRRINELVQPMPDG